MLPEAVVKRLGLPLSTAVNVRYADGRSAKRRAVKGVFVRLLADVAQLLADFTPKEGLNRQISRFFVVKIASSRCSEDLIEP